jgi:tRNA-specific 2-thiouridylase
MDKRRVLVGMSGGVDSSVAAALLQDGGYEVIGVTLKLYDYAELDFDPPDGGCCSIDLIDDARSVCSLLDVPHYVLDLRDSFRKNVIENFIDSYAGGRTPNPCVACNTYIKWGEMLRTADKLDCYYVATGHYARIQRAEGTTRLLRGVDEARDQSYALWGISEEALSRTLFPLGRLSKIEVRERAGRYGFCNADRPDSQEICFVPAGDYSRIIRQNAGESGIPVRPGPIIDQDGNVVGCHKGIARYTIGQRRGLGISHPEPLYVTHIDAVSATVTVGPQEKLYNSRFTVSDVNMVAPAGELADKVNIKIRYRHKAGSGMVNLSNGAAEVLFDHPERAITPGQSAVFYRDDVVLGGGIIDRVIG